MYFGFEHKMKVVEVAKYYIFSLKKSKFCITQKSGKFAHFNR